MKPKLILKLIEAHYQQDEKQFLEYANRIVQCFHSKAKPFVAEMIDAQIKRGLVLLETTKSHQNCVHGQSCELAGITSCHGCKQWILKK